MKLNLYIIFLLFAHCISCKKFIAVDPPSTVIISATAFSSDASATSAMLGIYSRMMENPEKFSGGATGISALCGMSADELTEYSTEPSRRAFYTNTLSVTNTYIYVWWAELYNYIYQCNAILEGLDKSGSVTSEVKQHLRAETAFIRSYCYFYLTNLYGEVPLILSTDYTQNARASSASTQDLYARMVTDLQMAKQGLGEEYIDARYGSTSDRLRPNRHTAGALLARIYLYQKAWQSALLESDTIINSGLYVLPEDLSGVFLKNSPEAIWQLSPVAGDFSTFDGYHFILNSAPSPFTSTGTVAISQELLDAFEAGDQRKSFWVGTLDADGMLFYYPAKYRQQTAAATTVKEYQVVIRLAEIFLIRAECKAALNDVAGAQADLNTIRIRAGIPGTTANSTVELENAIFQERRVELFTEYGHRWLDLKRSNRAGLLLRPIKGIGWQPTDILYPIPQSEIQNDPYLKQNEGY